MKTDTNTYILDNERIRPLFVFDMRCRQYADAYFHSEICKLQLVHSGNQLPCAETVFVPVVAIHRGDVAVGVGVVLPAATVINHIVDTPDRIIARDTQPYGIVFAIFGGGEIERAE